MKKRQLGINLIASLCSFIVNLGISFFLTPYIVRKLGDEAYGFIGLANNFVSYANILTTALNAMAARFITIEIHKGNNEKANTYFNSVLIANLIMSVIILLFSTFIIINLEKILDISNVILRDVKITFFIVFFNFIVSIMLSVFNVATFAKNRLDLASLRNIIANILKLIITLLMFIMLPAKISYLAIGALMSTIFIGISNISLSKKIMPEIKVSYKKFDLNSIKILISVGVWNSMASLSNMLMTGLDLIIANLFLNGYLMGLLSVSKTVPMAIQSLISLIASIFTPTFMALYAKNKIEKLVLETKIAMKIQTLLMTVPIAGFIVFSREFYSLWLPSKSEAEIIQISIISFLTLMPWILNAYVESLYSHNIILNKVKVSVIVTFILGIVSSILVIFLLKNTNMGLYAIAGVSSIFLTLRILFFTPIYAAYILKLSWKTYYPELLKSILIFILTLLLFVLLKGNKIISTWTELCITSCIFSLIGYIFNILILLNKKDFKNIKNKILKKKKERG